MEIKTNVVKAALCLVLVAVSTATLFVPVAEGADEVKAMFVMLTGLAVRDFFSGVQSDKRAAENRSAEPEAPKSFVQGG